MGEREKDREHGRVDLRALDLAAGAGTRLDLEVAPEDVSVGGQRYAVRPVPVPVRVDLSLSPSGWLFRLRFAASVAGPCVRCLAEARVALEIDTREFAASARPPGAPFDDDLDSEYVASERLDVTTWARDAIVEVLPDVIVCREDCAGLCPTCGADLNAGACGCPDEAPIDPRWGPLAALADRLPEDPGGSTAG